MCVQSLSSILEHMEEYLKPIIPLFTFPETRYQLVIFSESSQGGEGKPSSSHQMIGSRHQLKLVLEGARGCCTWGYKPHINQGLPGAHRPGQLGIAEGQLQPHI